MQVEAASKLDERFPWDKLAADALRQLTALLRSAGVPASHVVQGRRDTRRDCYADQIAASMMGKTQGTPLLPVSVTIPATTITISSPLHLEILRAISQDGLARSWRIALRMLTSGMAENENSVRNALRRLTTRGLIVDYMEQGRPVGWTPTRGGSRRLVLLTETGRIWCRAAFRAEPLASEVSGALTLHQSIEHSIGVLESRDYLRAAGYRVDDEPRAILAVAAERWGMRTEPDLLMEMEGELWPVEVQREVSQRTLAKWEKSITLAGRLALILFSAEHAAKQYQLLRSTKLARQIPLADVRLAGLEDMQHGNWRWRNLGKP